MAQDSDEIDTVAAVVEPTKPQRPPFHPPRTCTGGACSARRPCCARHKAHYSKASSTTTYAVSFEIQWASFTDPGSPCQPSPTFRRQKLLTRTVTLPH